MKIRAALIAACMLFTAAYTAETVQGEYTVELTPDAENKAKGTDKAYTDTIVIKDGKLMTAVSKRQGFKAGDVEVKVNGDKIKITAKLTGRGTGRYELELQGETLTGRLIWDCDPGSNGPVKHAEYGIKGKKK
jgi:hypothetical protein